MKLIRSLMGRRQFLFAAGAASASALVFKKLAGVVAPRLKTIGATASDSFTSIAMASEKPGTADMKGTSNRYSHLLSPLRIRNVFVKNRMLYTVSTPHFLQGPEVFPAEEVRTYYSNVAKNAAIVSLRTSVSTRPRKERTGDNAHMPIWDGDDPSVQNYIDQAVEGVHCMGSLVYPAPTSTAPRAAETSVIEEIVTRYKKIEDQGFDVVSMGGIRDLNNKDAVRTALEQMQAVQKATNLIIMTSMSVMEPLVSRPMAGMNERVSGLSLEQAIAMAKTLEGSADILVLRVAGGMANHPTSFNQEKGKPWPLRFAQAIKDSGAKIITCPNGGFNDPDLNEDFIASGKTDMIAMARAFIADQDYVKKAIEGRGDDVVPCLMCNKCHGPGANEPWISVCPVNPKLGITTAVRSIDAPGISKKVAVIGGGPAGMKAAITATERGHKVTLYEKSNSLGGQLRHADYSPYKWTYKDFKDYLIRQVKKAGVEVQLSTNATPDMIKAKGYDTVLVAAGAEPVIPKILGADGKNVWNIVDVYGREKELGKNVVIVGGGLISVETGMYLAKYDHKVTILTSEKALMERGGPHQSEIITDMYQQMQNFSFILEATTKGISAGKVTYVDDKGSENSITADSVVVYAGLKPRMDEAMKFSGSANQFLILGDCSGKGGNVQKSIRSAFFVASQV